MRQTKPKTFVAVLFVFFLFISFFNSYIGAAGILLAVLLHFYYPQVSSSALSNLDFKKSLPIPFVVLNGQIIAESSALLPFETGRRLTDYISGFAYKEARQSVHLNERNFLILSSRIKDYSVVFFIEKEPVHISTSSFSEVALGLVFIDNYDEVFETLEDVKKPLMEAMIDRKLNALAQKTEGVLRKFEKDRYIFIFYKDKLDYMKEKKFDILDQIREIEMGNALPVTLSIGIGLLGDTLPETMDYARAALDLALGRGGDQVLVKDKQGYSFFGGKTKESANNTRVRARVKAYVLSELVDEAHDVLIIGHKNADLDCLGAAVGVYKIAESQGKKCHIVLNAVTPAIRILHDRLVNEADYGTKIFMNTAAALKQISDYTLLVIVDTHRPDMTEAPELLSKAKKIVVFDHHRRSTDYIENPVMTYHEPYASSTCELITEMLLYVTTKIKMKNVEADALLAGITVDTKSFHIKTGARTFEAAAYLRRNGADSARVNKFFKYNMSLYKAKANAVSSAKIYNGKYAISQCIAEPENLILSTAQAADELLTILGIEASFVFFIQGEKVYISARSNGDMNVQMVMEKLGGGGHQIVAGAQLYNLSPDETEKCIKEAIDMYLGHE